eukprot:9403729-Pyramimonas_sp.AAC.1
MCDRELHLHSCRGCKLTGATVALGGSEDRMKCREATYFWGELGMRARLDSAVAEVSEKCAAGLLPWTCQT